MKKLRIHLNPNYWHQDQHQIELTDGSFYDFTQHNYDQNHGCFGDKHHCYRNGQFTTIEGYHSHYALEIAPEGIYYMPAHGSSGTGYIKRTEQKKLIIPSSTYDEIEYVGKPFKLTDSIRESIAISTGNWEKPIN